MRRVQCLLIISTSVPRQRVDWDIFIFNLFEEPSESDQSFSGRKGQQKTFQITSNCFRLSRELVSKQTNTAERLHPSRPRASSFRAVILIHFDASRWFPSECLLSFQAKWNSRNSMTMRTSGRGKKTFHLTSTLRALRQDTATREGKSEIWFIMQRQKAFISLENLFALEIRIAVCRSFLPPLRRNIILISLCLPFHSFVSQMSSLRWLRNNSALSENVNLIYEQAEGRKKFRSKLKRSIVCGEDKVLAVCH